MASIDVQLINLGEYPNDPNADSLYTAFTKVNFNFENISELVADGGVVTGDQVVDIVGSLFLGSSDINVDVNPIGRITVSLNGEALDQDLVPRDDNTYSLGAPDKRWANIYASNFETDSLSATAFSAQEARVDFSINFENSEGNITIGSPAVLDYDNLNPNSANTVIGAATENIEFVGSNNTVIGAGATPSNVNVSNEVTIGNEHVTALRIPGVNVNVVNGVMTVGVNDPITNITYNGDPNKGTIYSPANPMPSNQKLQVGGSMAVGGVVSAERVDTYLDAGYF